MFLLKIINPTSMRLLAFVLLAWSWGANAQVKLPLTPFGKMYLPVWLEAKRHCLDVANAMPDSLYAYRPTTVSKSFAEQMVHIAHTIPLLCKRYVEGLDVKSAPPDASTMSKQEIIKMLTDSFDYVTGVIYEIPQAKLDETCVMYHSGNTVSRALAFIYVQDHMANHRAKANLYIRMNNITPPEYTW